MFCASLIWKKCFGNIQNNIHTQTHSYSFLLFKYAMPQAWVSHDMIINTMNRHVRGWYLRKGLTECSAGWFGSPRSWNTWQTPTQFKYSVIPKEWLRNSKVCLWHHFNLGCASWRNSCNRAAAHLCALLFSLKLLFWDERNARSLDKVTASYFIILWCCKVSLMSLFCMSSPSPCDHVQTFSYGWQDWPERVKIILNKH